MTETPVAERPAAVVRAAGAPARADQRPERCVLVVDRDLPPGLAANAAAVLALSVGARFPGLVGPDVVDGDATVHPGLVSIGLPVLGATAAELGALRAAALGADVHVVGFPTVGQQTTDYEQFRAMVAATPAAELGYLGLALCGRAKPVRRLTSGLALLR